MTRHAVVVLIALAAGACSSSSGPQEGADDGRASTPSVEGGAPDASPGPDPTPTQDASAAKPAGMQIAAGIGDNGNFVRVADGTTLLLQRGCQGAQHIFTSIRIVGSKSPHLLVEILVRRTDDGVTVSAPLSSVLPVEPDPLSDLAGRISGLTPVIEVPSDVLGRSVEVRTTVTDPANKSRATAGFRGVVQWGPDSCRAH